MSRKVRRTKSSKNRKKKATATSPKEPTAAYLFPDLRSRFAFIMPCMGRLDHVQKSVPALMSAAPMIDNVHNWLVFVDFYCPEQSGTWVHDQYEQRATVVSLNEDAPLSDNRQPLFNKPLAHNHGALSAIEMGAEYLVFVDADTLVTPQLIWFVFSQASRERFMIFRPNFERKDLTGFLVVHRDVFLKINGFDQAFEGWGAEDLEMRVKLLLKGKTPANDSRAILKDPHRYLMPWTEIPEEIAASIPHEDALRVAHYEEKNKDQSHGLNLNRLCSNIFNWTGKHPVELHETPLGPYIRRLLGMELYASPKTFE